LDEDRAGDGISMRYRYAITEHEHEDPDAIIDQLDGPCTVLEMLVALANRCEEEIMDNPNIGNRTSQWFWGMITTMGLGAMTDNAFDDVMVYDILDRFMAREYEPDGRGGLFRLRGCPIDLREIDIWCQLSWYLGSIT
jgi:hypothetical protein